MNDLEYGFMHVFKSFEHRSRDHARNDSGSHTDAHPLVCPTVFYRIAFELVVDIGENACGAETM